MFFPSNSLNYTLKKKGSFILIYQLSISNRDQTNTILQIFNEKSNHWNKNEK